MIKGNKRDPYSYAGKLGVETGPVPLRRWTPSRVLVTMTSSRDTILGTTQNGKQLKPGEIPPWPTK